MQLIIWRRGFCCPFFGFSRALGQYGFCSQLFNKLLPVEQGFNDQLFPLITTLPHSMCPNYSSLGTREWIVTQFLFMVQMRRGPCTNSGYTSFFFPYSSGVLVRSALNSVPVGLWLDPRIQRETNMLWGEGDTCDCEGFLWPGRMWKFKEVMCLISQFSKNLACE